MVRKRTRERLSVSVSPHLFRDAVATFIVEMKPQWAMIAAALQHTDYRITEKHYMHGQQHRAGRLYSHLRSHAGWEELILTVQSERGAAHRRLTASFTRSLRPID
jgi:integrase